MKDFLHDVDVPNGWSLVPGNRLQADYARWALEIGPSLSQALLATLDRAALPTILTPSTIAEVASRDPNYSLVAYSARNDPLDALAKLIVEIGRTLKGGLYVIIEDRLSTGVFPPSKDMMPLELNTSVGKEEYIVWQEGDELDSLYRGLRVCSSLPTFGVHVGVRNDLRSVASLWNSGLKAVVETLVVSAMYAYDGEGFIFVSYLA